MKCLICGVGKMVVTKEALSHFEISENGTVDWSESTTSCCDYDKDLVLYCNNCSLEISHDYVSNCSTKETEQLYQKIERS